MDHTGARASVLLALVVLLSPLGLSPLGLATAAPPASFAVAQGTSCSVVAPVTNTSQSAADFYDYRNPYTNITGNPAAQTYSSYGTRAYQANQGSSLLFYQGSGGTNLVIVHDDLGDERGGSTVSFEVSGLPAGGSWVVQDDQYPGRNDNWGIGATTASIDWKWAANRTDGGVYSGLEADSYGPIAIEPSFNERADKWGEWGHSGAPENRITSWTLWDADGSSRALDRNRTLYIHRGSCGATAAPTASLSAPATAPAGQDATFDASGSSDDEAVAGYEWDFDGDGTVDRTTSAATVTHRFTAAGNHTVRVTAFDTYGNGDTATASVAVSGSADTAPTAALDGPRTATAGQSLTLDASGSSDDTGISAYRWDFDGDGVIDQTTSAPTAAHTYAAAGNYTARVTVVDAANQTDSASHAVSVTATGGDSALTADFTAPSSATVNQTVTFDASASTGNGTSYAWTFGDGTTATGRRVTHAFSAAGAYPVQLTVGDGAGHRNATTRTVTVGVAGTPRATLSVPSSATVGQNVTFDASGSSDDTGISAYRWDFDGDGAVDRTTSGPTTEYAYAAAGNYTAGVTVVDAGNRSATATAPVEVSSALLSPAFTVPRSPRADDSLSFDATASAPAGDIVQYAWMFGDGGSATGRRVTHTYASSGRYRVTLRVENGSGASATTAHSLAVAGPANGGGNGGSGGNGNAGGGNGDGNANGGGSHGNGSDGNANGGGNGGSGGPPPEPSFSLTVAPSARTVVQGAPFHVNVTVTNTGTGVGTKEVEFDGDGTAANRTVRLAPGDSRTIRFDHRFSDPGTETVEIDNNRTFEVTVLRAEPDIEVTDVSVAPAEANGSVHITADVANHGTAAGTAPVRLHLFDEVVAVRDVTLAPDERGTVTFRRRIEAPGTYTAAVGNRSVTVSVGDETTANASRETEIVSTTGADMASSRFGVPMAGFGGAALVVVLAVGALLVRRVGL